MKQVFTRELDETLLVLCQCIYICVYYVATVLSYTGEYTEDFTNLTRKKRVTFEISRKIAMDTLGSEMVINDKENVQTRRQGRKPGYTCNLLH